MRSYSRFNTDHEITCIVGSKGHTAQLYNLSSGGCMIEMGQLSIAQGDEVNVKLRGQTILPGVIAWQVGKSAGIKFAVPLHHRVVESFGYQTGGEDFDRYDPRDRFGIPLLDDADEDISVHMFDTYTQIVPAGNERENGGAPQADQTGEMDPPITERAATLG